MNHRVYICNFNHNTIILYQFLYQKTSKKVEVVPYQSIPPKFHQHVHGLLGDSTLRWRSQPHSPTAHRGATKGSRWTKIQWWNPSEVTSEGDDTANDMCLNVYIYICKIYIYLSVYKYIYIFSKYKCIHVLSKYICIWFLIIKNRYLWWPLPLAKTWWSLLVVTLCSSVLCFF